MTPEKSLQPRLSTDRTRRAHARPTDTISARNPDNRATTGTQDYRSDETGGSASLDSAVSDGATGRALSADQSNQPAEYHSTRSETEHTATDITVDVIAFACCVSATATFIQPSLLLAVTTAVLTATLVVER